MDIDASEAAERTPLQDLSGDLRASLTAILTHATALSNADGQDGGRAERAAILDRIQQEGQHALELLERSSAKAQTRQPENQPKRQPAYFVWLRSRLEQIETAARTERYDVVGKLALELKDSASSKGYREVSEAGAAVARLSDAGGLALEAGVEILRRTVNRATRTIRSDAA